MITQSPPSRECPSPNALVGSPLYAAATDLGNGSAETTTIAPPDNQPEDLPIEDAPGKTLGWAIVGLGTVALGEILPAFAECRIARPVALVSGHQEKAMRTASAYGIDEDAIYDYENFDRIAEDPRIDVVYIALPNSLHASFTIRALRAGKHVLCEKPMAVSVEEGMAMARAADEAGKMLGIAYRLHFEPMNQQVMEWCQEKRFGEVQSFNSSHCQEVSAPNIRLSKALGGGPVGDLGIYSINAARYCLNEEPVEVTAFANQPENDPRFDEVPESVAFILRYPSGALAVCDCSFGTSPSRRYRVHCSEGYIEMNPAFSYHSLELITATTRNDHEEITHLVLDQVNHFSEELDGFSQAVLGKAENLIPAALGIADLRIIAAIEESLRTRAPARIEAQL
jgi:predicted dehydrogenase